MRALRVLTESIRTCNNPCIWWTHRMLVVTLSNMHTLPGIYWCTGEQCYKFPTSTALKLHGRWRVFRVHEGICTIYIPVHMAEPYGSSNFRIRGTKLDGNICKNNGFKLSNQMEYRKEPESDKFAEAKRLCKVFFCPSILRNIDVATIHNNGRFVRRSNRNLQLFGKHKFPATHFSEGFFFWCVQYIIICAGFYAKRKT